MITIEVANGNDKGYLQGAIAALFEHVRDASQDDYLLRLKDDYLEDLDQWIDGILAADESRIYVANNDGASIGYIIGTITRPFVRRCTVKAIGLIEHCWVEREYRKSGVAAQLVKTIERWFEEHHIRYVDVQYLLGNAEAEVTWERLGYRPYRVVSRKAL